MSLHLEHVGYRYAGSPAPVLHDIELALEPGRIVGLIGPNEAGKSTICLVAVGLAPRTIGGELAGRVLIDDLDTANAAPHELAQHAGILFQGAYAQLSGATPTVWEEIAFGPRNLSLPLAEVELRTWEAAQALGIEALVERDPGRLSGGQAQLVALAGVLALRPRYLVLDEPTSELDPQGTRVVGDALARAAEVTGAGILIVEHKTSLLAGLCHEAVLIDGGRIIRSGRAEAVLADPELEARGVALPPRERLRRAVESAGHRWRPEWA
jgi:energy-coupling factor transport system ATP-binding protein